jgi:type II secretion system protein C
VLPARTEQKEIDWRGRAPRWTAAVLAGVVVAEAGQLAWVLRTIANTPVPDPVGPLKAPPRSFHWWRLAGAHLFGVVEKHPEQNAAHPVVPAITWSLTATMATSDPAKGFAILGIRGKPLTVYSAGMKLVEVGEGHLIQVFVDHVVLDLQGHTEIVNLPQKAAGGRVLQMVAGAPALAAPQPGPDELNGRVPPTGLESLMAALNLEPTPALNGKPAGMTLHPLKSVGRQYGLHEGDILTSLNGVSLVEPGALAKAMKISSDVASLTYIRDGSEQTVDVSLAAN